MGESRVQENVYMGSQITSVTDSTFYIDDCIFTSCDPSKFYLGSKQVKIIYGDKVIAKPLSNLYWWCANYRNSNCYFPSLI